MLALSINKCGLDLVNFPKTQFSHRRVGIIERNLRRNPLDSKGKGIHLRGKMSLVLIKLRLQRPEKCRCAKQSSDCCEARGVQFTETTLWIALCGIGYSAPQSTSSWWDRLLTKCPLGRTLLPILSPVLSQSCHGLHLCSQAPLVTSGPHLPDLCMNLLAALHGLQGNLDLTQPHSPLSDALAHTFCLVFCSLLLVP